MTVLTDILTNHKNLSKRREQAYAGLHSLRSEFAKHRDILEKNKIAIYLAGSISRGDIGKKSDLDLFLITDSDNTESDKIPDEIIQCLKEIYKSLGYEFLADDPYMKIYNFHKMGKSLGSPKDDNENSFTARMLLLLESRGVYNDDLYNQIIEGVVSHYFRDSRGRESFRPLFLLNDILRYWRTLCLNYEAIRNDPDKPWGKKNINLRFSRMLTVFSTVLSIIVKQDFNKNDLIELTGLSPHERFVKGLELLSGQCHKNYHNFLDNYEKFLDLKETWDDNNLTEDIKRQYREDANSFSKYIYQALTHDDIDDRFKRFLII